MSNARMFEIASDYMAGTSRYEDHWMAVIFTTLGSLTIGGLCFGFCLAGVLTGYAACWIGVILGGPVLMLGLAGLAFSLWYLLSLLCYEKWSEFKEDLRISIKKIDDRGEKLRSLEEYKHSKREEEKQAMINTNPPTTDRPDFVVDTSLADKTTYRWWKR